MEKELNCKKLKNLDYLLQQKLNHNLKYKYTKSEKLW